jgi:hypothetical protein
MKLIYSNRPEDRIHSLQREYRELKEKYHKCHEALEKAEAGQAHAEKLLHDLTPGGSEFVGRPNRCFEWIQNHITSLTNRAVTAHGKLNEMRDAEEKRKIDALPWQPLGARGSTLTDRQVENLRKMLFFEIGPAALSLTVEAVEQYRDRLQAHIDQYAKEEKGAKS